MSFMSRNSSPRWYRSRECASLSSLALAAASTSGACARGTITTPSSSPTTTSPGSTAAPAHVTGTLTDPSRFFTVPWADTHLDHTGNFIAVSSTMSRQPASITSPRTPRAAKVVASSSPKYPYSEGDSGATINTSPGSHCSTATWIIQLSSGGRLTVTAVPQTRAPG